MNKLLKNANLEDTQNALNFATSVAMMIDKIRDDLQLDKEYGNPDFDIIIDKVNNKISIEAKANDLELEVVEEHLKLNMKIKLHTINWEE
tara:strand:+ start:667 stop:936 length:270 start_codon:yes stop_codon:yes gene_type:complete